MKTPKLVVFSGCFLALAACGVRTEASDSAVPGRSVGRVLLGMDRADVWKILGMPRRRDAGSEGTSRYWEDTWTGSGHTLTVVTEEDKVVQVGFDSPRMTTTRGLSTRSTLGQVRRLYPSLTVRGYTVLTTGTLVGTGTNRHRLDDGSGANGYWLDDVPGGVAFTIQTQDAATPGWLDHSPVPVNPNTIVIHRPGHAVIPIVEGGWAEIDQPPDDPNSLRLVRSWFTTRKH
jgi:hypothetical protein